MIGKGKSISHTVNAIEYAETKLKAVEIDRNLISGETPQEIAKEFKNFQDLNTRCEKNTFSFVISPSIDDSKKLTENDYRNITRDFLKKLDIGQNQYVAYLHQDKAHTHIHVYCNRIDITGYAEKDNYIGKRSQRAAEEIARERNMTIAKEVQKEKILQQQMELKPYSLKIQEAHKKALSKNPENLKQYSILMENQGIKTHLKFAADNKKCVGIKYQIGDVLIKGSTVGKLFSGMNVQQAIIKNLTKVITKSFDIGMSL